MQPSAFKQQQYNQFEVRKSQYNVHWKTDLIGAICAAPCSCLVALVCPPCFSYYVRKRVLYNDLSRYVCCNGDCPCSGRMSEQSCPEVCLGLEVFFCFAQSVASSRWAIQDEQHIRNTACDNCIIGTMIVSQYVACICNIAACLSGSSELGAIADVADSIAHFLWVTVCACMQTQAKVQLDERDHNPGVVRPPFNPLQAPQQQGIPTSQQPGYPPQQGGYPPQQGGYPPQQGGYPPQQGGYPPPQGYQGQPPNYPPQGYPGAPQGYPGAQQMSR